MAPRGILLAASTASFVLAIGIAQAIAGEPVPSRQEALLYRLTQDCGSCHGMTLKGGLGPPLLPAALADKPDEVLVDVILHGLPDTPMPPWGFELSRSEAAWLVRRMKQGLDHGRDN